MEAWAASQLLAAFWDVENNFCVFFLYFGFSLTSFTETMINEENQTKKAVQGETRTHVTLLQSSTKNIMFSVRLMNYL